MLHNIVFTDNIFIVSRSLALIAQSLQLDFSDELFVSKFEHDIVFCAESIKKIFSKLNAQEHLHDYIDTMKCLYSCTSRFIQIMSDLEIDNKNIFLQSPEKIGVLKSAMNEIEADISKKVRNTNTDAEIMNIVSEIELTELLDFGNATSVQIK